MATIATLTLDAVAEGRTFEVRAEIGTPYRCESGEWACPIALDGLWDRLGDARGADALQALCLAIRLIRSLLSDFRAAGGALTVEGEPFRPESYAF